jgi:hypothetical protein
MAFLTRFHAGTVIEYVVCGLTQQFHLAMPSGQTDCCHVISSNHLDVRFRNLLRSGSPNSQFPNGSSYRHGSRFEADER